MKRFLLLMVCVCSVAFAVEPWKPLPHTVPIRSVILMIPDGTSSANVTFARKAKGGALVLDQLLRGAVNTASANDLVTDSAAAATAMATGYRTNNAMVGLLPDKTRLINLQELARSKGKRVGIVTTDAYHGATPSSFVAHTTHRDNCDEITKQFIEQKLDLVLAGGRRALMPALRERPDAALTVVTTAKEMFAAPKTQRVWGAFAPGVMTPMVSRISIPSAEPTLAEMTTFALDYLADSPNGFFLMIEGASVDKGNHDGDIAYATGELLAFDDAVRVVCTFVNRHPDTVVIIAPDHETGGLTLPKGYTAEPFLRAQQTIAEMVKGLSKSTPTAEFVGRLKAFYSLDLTPEQRTALSAAVQAKGPAVGMSDFLSREIYHVNYSTRGNCGGEVPLWGYGNPKSLPTGLIQNDEIAFWIADLLGGELSNFGVKTEETP